MTRGGPVPISESLHLPGFLWVSPALPSVVIVPSSPGHLLSCVYQVAPVCSGSGSALGLRREASEVGARAVASYGPPKETQQIAGLEPSFPTLAPSPPPLLSEYIN